MHVTKYAEIRRVARNSRAALGRGGGKCVSLIKARLVERPSAFAGGISDDIVKIGVLTDISGQFSQESGEGAVTAVKMAVDDFGGYGAWQAHRGRLGRSSEQARNRLGD
jgi:hypothetical protein